MTGLVLRRGTYYYRQRIPTDLRQHFDQGHIRRSLHTQDANAAKTLAASCAARVQHTFSLLRSGALSPTEGRSLTANLCVNLANVKGNGRHDHPGIGQSSPAGNLLIHSADVTAHMQPVLAPLTLGLLVERYVAEHVARHKWTGKLGGKLGVRP